MSSLLPIRSDASPGQQDPRVVDLEGEEADEVFNALSSKTARTIVTELHEEPRTQSDLAEDIDTTVQNVRYHLDKLEDAGLVEVVDTWYSSRGNEMKVFAPADGALIVSGDRGRASRLKTALSRLVGGVSVIGFASLLVQVTARRLGNPVSLGTSGDDAAGGSGGEDLESGDGPKDGGGMESYEMRNETREKEADVAVEEAGNDTIDASTTVESQADPTRGTTETVQATGTPEGTSTETVTATDTPVSPETTTSTSADTVETTRTATDGGGEMTTTAADVASEGSRTAVDAAASGVPPGLLFFLGGVSVLVVLTGIWYFSGT
ncbi:ArsR family transcriptional regulator [Halobacteriales archaeon QS_8_69_26]|nr:MAG: ArsR family transcriptional regulator [Halobacteriales archaeon QS_8_69_26]